MLVAHGLGRKRRLQPAGERLFEAPDTLTIGLQELEEKVSGFNSSVVEPLDLPARMFGAELDDSERDKEMNDAAEYVAATDDTFHETGPVLYLT